MNILIAIAGIIFGGGMIGQLIMFFVKRNDDLRLKKNDDLHVLLDKISEYGKFVNDHMVQSIRHLNADLQKSTSELALIKEGNADAEFINQVNKMHLNIEVERVLEKVNSFNGLVNLLPQAYMYKHNHIVDMIGKLDIETFKILLINNEDSFQRYSQMNESIVNQLILIEKLKLAIAKEIK